jgi:two-component system, NtrC family, response regulator HydG
LSAVLLELPPLRMRKSDVLLLAQHFLERFARASGRTLRGFDESARSALLAYPWPGNVRELEHVVERAVLRCEGDEIGAAQLALASHETGTDTRLLAPGVTLAELERMAIVQTLEAVDGSTARAADLLGISRRKIQYRLKEWGLTGACHEDGDETEVRPRERMSQ